MARRSNLWPCESLGRTIDRPPTPTDHSNKLGHARSTRIFSSRSPITHLIIMKAVAAERTFCFEWERASERKAGI